MYLLVVGADSVTVEGAVDHVIEAAFGDFWPMIYFISKRRTRTCFTLIHPSKLQYFSLFHTVNLRKLPLIRMGEFGPPATPGKFASRSRSACWTTVPMPYHRLPNGRFPRLVSTLVSIYSLCILLYSITFTCRVSSVCLGQQVMGPAC
jgi:hypothetical protein